MKIRQVLVDHTKIRCWVYKFIHFIESEANKEKGRVGASWRLDGTYSKIKGTWCYLYRALDKLGNTVDFLLDRKIQRWSAYLILIKSIRKNYKSGVINIYKSGSNTTAIKVYNKRSLSKIKPRL
ncbi:DDE-type integrase/transposase/recombinase [Flavobacterium sp. LC2016-23]|uniref:DDE-type integrase/transposase/recombinase n=1 Tax=Flavobacterium sp. LC2016-23 TaxID=2666330 RepID=UPI0012AF3B57|nr:DDE-type integrase/transposase/recombinase [Flavobacterium sp. LC2016-23]